MHTFFKWGLLSYVLFLFLCIGIGGRTTTTYAMNSHLLATTATPQPTPKPTPTPTPKPTPTPAAIQPPMSTPTPQVGPVPTSTVQPTPTATVVATPANTPVSAVPTPVAATRDGVKMRLPVPIYPPEDNALTLALALGVAAPLLLISGGALWLLVKWEINRPRQASITADISHQSINGRKSVFVPK